MSGLEDDLIVCFTFFLHTVKTAVWKWKYFSGVIQATQSGEISSAGSQQLRKVSKNVGAMQPEDPDRCTLLLLSEELRHDCKGVFGSSWRLVLFCNHSCPVTLPWSFSSPDWAEHWTFITLTRCSHKWPTVWPSECVRDIEPGSSANTQSRQCVMARIQTDLVKEALDWDGAVGPHECDKWLTCDSLSALWRQWNEGH